MDYREYPPPAALRPWVRTFWTLEAATSTDADAGAAGEPVLPDGCAELLVHYGDRYRLRSRPDGGTDADRDKSTLQSYAIIGGTIRTAIQLEPTGATGIVSARFEPHGATGLFHDSALRFTDRLVDLASLMPVEARELTERIRAAADTIERVALLCAFLERRILGRALGRRSAGRPPLDPAVAYAIRTIDAAAGNLAVAAIPEALGTSRRTLERRFVEAVGLSPKAYARIVRLQTAVRTIEGDPTTSLAGAALAAGYYDQAHFNRDFRAFAGQSPSSYFASRHDLAASLANG